MAQAHRATRVAANDKPGRLTLCRYILRPPLANDRLHILPDGAVRLEFKRPWSDGTTSIGSTFIARCLTQTSGACSSRTAPASPASTRREGQAGQQVEIHPVGRAAP
jgi:Putative transposase